jgi:quinol monooxygenase YgiN
MTCYKDMEALQRHTRTPHFITLVEQLSFFEKELPVLIYKKLF